MGLKPPTTIPEQIEILKSRGVFFEDLDTAAKILSQISYYRLSGYFLSFKDTNHENQFFFGTTFSQVYRLYEFDTILRQLLFSSIENIEIAFRTKLANFLALKHGPLSYLDSNIFLDQKHFKSFKEDFDREKKHQRNTAFVKHHKEQYGDTMPVWAAVEICSFGMMSKLYINLKTDDKEDFVKNYYFAPSYLSYYLKSWLRCIVEVRNICAHYGRIYNRNMLSTPRMYPQFKEIYSANEKENTKRVFSTVIVIMQLLDEPLLKQRFITSLNALIESYDSVDLSFLGFPSNWNQYIDKAQSMSF